MTKPHTEFRVNPVPMKRRSSQAALTARPQPPSSAKISAASTKVAVSTELATPGLYPLNLSDGIRDGRLYIPPGMADVPRPLILLLHGAGGDGSSMLRLLDGAGQSFILLAPDARTHTWDFLNEARDPDVPFLDRALAETFARCNVDPARIAIAGFSDGASYALTVGLANGDLFTHVLAFSPGFMNPPQLQGRPRVFLSHGTDDAVLPIHRCSRRIVPELEHGRYDLLYREFPGPHTVPETILTEALQWFLEPVG